MIRSAGRSVVISHAVVGTITVTAVLIVYDGWASLRLRDVVAIIVGPVLAMFIAHAFARGLAEHARLRRRLSKRELVHTVGSELGWLWLAVPPTALLLVLNAFGVALSDSIRVVIWLGAAWPPTAPGYAAERLH